MSKKDGFFMKLLRFLVIEPKTGAKYILNTIAPLIKNDCFFLRMKWKLYMDYPLDMDNPRSFNEKQQWLKINDRCPIYTTMVDKVEAKKYVADVIGDNYIIPTLGVYESVEDIDFAELPDQFVLKCTHDSGGLVICKRKETFNIESAKKNLKKSLRSNYYWRTREWPYKNVKPRIIAEKYMEDEYGELRDYKFFCFNGKMKAMFIASDRTKDTETCFDFFDENYKHLDFRNGHPNATKIPAKPKTFELMKQLAEKLSAGIPCLRVDFYEVDGKVFFGELTFTHWSGMKPFEPEEWDYKFGSWIKLPSKK